MNTLSRSTRIARRFGFKTKEYQAALGALELKTKNDERRQFFLSRPRNEVVEKYPETKAIFNVQDQALRFYSDVLITTPTSLHTNKRNQLRAKATAFDGFDFLDNNEEAPAFTREGRFEEAGRLRAEELQTLRSELNTSFEDNARVNPALKKEAFARYAAFSNLYFKDDKEAIRQHPELQALTSIKKQANRYFSQWVVSDQIDNAVKDCLNRAIKDLARHIPLPNAEEIKAEALALRSSWIGTHSTSPNAPKSKKNTYQYKGINLMRELLGKNGVEQGWWPYNPDLLEHTDRISQIDTDILKEQWITSFHTEPKDEVLEKFPKLGLLYNKLDAARSFYNEKMAAPFAEEAALALLAPDFDRLLENKPLQAVSEIAADVHEGIMERIKHQLQVEGKDQNLVEAAKPFNQILKNFTRIQGSQFNELDASNENFPDDKSPVLVPEIVHTLSPKPGITLEQIAEQIKQLKDQLTEAGLSQKPLDALLQKQLGRSETEVAESTILSVKDAGLSSGSTESLIIQSTPTVSLDALRSTAPDLPINVMFESSHISKTILSETKGAQWDVKALTDGLNANSEDVAIMLLGEPIARENGQLRFGSNKGSMIVTIQGSKQGLWYDHQTGEGGNLLQLIQQQQGLLFKEALDYAGHYLNQTPELRAQNTIDVSDIDANVTDDLKGKIAYVRELANKSQPIQGTLAETYLAKTRGIDTSVCSDSVRFMPSMKEPETGEHHPALLILSKNIKGKVQGAQAIFLDKSGKKLVCKTPKRSYGVLKGASAPIHFGGNIYALAEGLETGLSVAHANKNLTVFASLGSMTNFSAMTFKNSSNTLIIFADHDGADHEAQLKMNKAADELHQKGFNVLISTPKDRGKDFNDILREKGVDAVKQEMNQLTMHTPSIQKNVPSMSQGRGLDRAKKFKTEQELEL